MHRRRLHVHGGVVMSAIKHAIEELRSDIANKQTVLDRLVELDEQLSGGVSTAEPKSGAAKPRAAKNGGGRRVKKQDGARGRARPTNPNGVRKNPFPIMGECKECGHQFLRKGPRTPCPKCGEEKEAA